MRLALKFNKTISFLAPTPPPPPPSDLKQIVFTAWAVTHLPLLPSFRELFAGNGCN